MAKTSHDVKVVVRDPSLRGSSWFISCFCYHCHRLYTHSTEWTLMASVVYVDLNLEFDLGRTTCMQHEVFAQERQRRQTVTSSFCRTKKLLLHSLLPLLPPSSMLQRGHMPGRCLRILSRWNPLGDGSGKLEIWRRRPRSPLQVIDLSVNIWAFLLKRLSPIISNLNDLFVPQSLVSQVVISLVGLLLRVQYYVTREVASFAL